MRATVMYGAGDVRIESVPDARLVEPTDALVASPAPRSAAATCGRTRRWSTTRAAAGWATSSSASSKPSAPTCARSRPATSSSRRSSTPTAPASSAAKGCRPSCLHGGRYGSATSTAARARRCACPQADGTLVVAAGRRGRRADAVAAHALGRDGHRSPRRVSRTVRPGQDRRRSSATAPSACAA